MSSDESSDELEDRKSILEEGEREEDRERVEAFLHAICDEIDKNSLEMGGQRHRELAYLGNDVKIDIVIDIWGSTDEKDCVRLSALFGYFSSGRQYREDIGHKVKKYEGEFGSHKLYQLSKFLCFSSSDHPPHLQEAFSNGVAVADKMDQNPRFHAQLAAVGVDLVRRSDTLVSNLQMGRIDESKMLSISAKYAEKAYKEDPDREFSTQVYASVLVRQQRYEEALEVIKSRLPESEQEDSLDPYRREGPVSEQISHVQREKQRYELDNLSNELVFCQPSAA